jgi:Ser-tRNA(Ala) deacylase AlaX
MMTVKELAARVAALETEVGELKAKLAASEQPQKKSWLDLYGKYADDPVFDEVVRLGQEWREEDRRRTIAEMDREEAREKKKKSRRKKSNARA